MTNLIKNILLGVFAIFLFVEMFTPQYSIFPSESNKELDREANILITCKYGPGIYPVGPIWAGEFPMWDDSILIVVIVEDPNDPNKTVPKKTKKREITKMK